MKKIKSILSILFLGAIMFAFNSCSEDNPVIERSWEEGPTEDGTLEVFVKLGAASDTYASSAEVKIFTSAEARDLDDYYMANITDPDDARPGSGQGALFKNIPFNYYYINARWRQSSTSNWWMGVNETWVPKGKLIQLTVIATQ